jgi:hypothetical protein
LLPPQRLGISADDLLHVQGGIARPYGVVFMRQRGPEQRHDAVPHDLVDRALIAVDGGHEVFEYRVKELPGLLGIAVGQEFHRAFEVGKEHRDLLALAFEGGLGLENLLCQVHGHRDQRGTGLRLAQRSRARCPAGPYQHFPVLIHGEALRFDELGLQVLEGLIIELELPLQGAIGHAASTVEHGQRLVHNLLEGHGRSSTARCVCQESIGVV